MATFASGLVGLGSPPPLKSATVLANNNTVTLVSAVTGKCITPIHITVGTAAAVTVLELKDGSTTKWQICPSTGPVSVSAPAGGFLFKGTASTALNCTATTAGAAYVNVTYVEEDP